VKRHISKKYYFGQIDPGLGRPATMPNKLAGKHYKAGKSAPATIDK
jgi:hypothetical protein